MSPPSNSKWLIERWVTQMRPRTTNTSEGAASFVSTQLVGPPKSWSKFPSYNREMRNKNAGSVDKVNPRDFAVRFVTSEGQTCWATDMVPGEEKERASTLPRSLSTKLGKFLKSNMVKIIPSKDMQKSETRLPATGYVTPVPAGMQYPEMGIRPSQSGFQEIQALGREIINMKGKNNMPESERVVSKPRSSKSLGDKVFALVHGASAHRHPDHDEDAPQSTERPVMPLTPSLLRESIAATDVFLTPKSHFSSDAADDQRTMGLDREPTRMKDQEMQPAHSKSAAILSRPRSSTWTGAQVEELNPTSIPQLADQGSESTPRDSGGIPRYDGDDGIELRRNTC
ncbi:hypothetical protein F66182_12189 [Fusarium sp. NRRL 66182]|nr:hypothetical protein F66182_12189 [Fusarium sp. NRRL 66182]